jgi:hypothetical protein
LENLREGDNLEDLCVDGRIILQYILLKLDRKSLDWIDPALDMDM